MYLKYAFYMYLSNMTTTMSRICVAFVYLLDYNICKGEGLTSFFFLNHPKMWNIDHARLQYRYE